MNKRLMLENAKLRQQLGLPPVENIEMSLESSDEDQDSGGADTCQEPEQTFQFMPSREESGNHTHAVQEKTFSPQSNKKNPNDFSG